MNTRENSPLQAYHFNVQTCEYEASKPTDYDEPTCYMLADVDAYIAKLERERESMRKSALYWMDLYAQLERRVIETSQWAHDVVAGPSHES